MPYQYVRHLVVKQLLSFVVRLKNLHDELVVSEDISEDAII